MCITVRLAMYSFALNCTVNSLRGTFTVAQRHQLYKEEKKGLLRQDIPSRCAA